MSQGGLEVVITATILSIAIYILARKQDDIKALFIRVYSDKNAYRENSTKATLALKQSKAGMEEYERQVILDILRDQLAHSREDFSAFERDFEKVIARIETFEARVINELKAVQVEVGKNNNGLGQVNNRLDNYRLLLSRLEENTRK